MLSFECEGGETVAKCLTLHCKCDNSNLESAAPVRISYHHFLYKGKNEVVD